MGADMELFQLQRKFVAMQVEIGRLTARDGELAAELAIVRQEAADLRSNVAHLEEANGCLQERLAVMETQVEAMKSTIGQVVVLAAAVDSAGLESVGAKMGRMAAMEAKRAEVASRSDMGDVEPEGRLTPCPVVGCGLVGDVGKGTGSAEGGPS